MNVSPRHLRVFLTLAASLSFRRTAEAFFVTQPALTKVIQDLEAQLGVALFERTTRRVRLTAAGARLLPLARRTVGEFDAGLVHMRQLSERETQRLALASLPSLACALLPDVCADVEQAFPGAQLVVYDGSMEAALRRVEDSRGICLWSVIRTHDWTGKLDPWPTSPSIPTRMNSSRHLPKSPTIR